MAASRMLYATNRILLIALVTCMSTYRTMEGYFEFLSVYSFHLTHLCIWTKLFSYVVYEIHEGLVAFKTQLTHPKKCRLYGIKIKLSTHDVPCRH